MNKDTILIAGAGPVGLAAALFLVKKGFRPRIIDKAVSASSFSKAFGINPRTLSLLEGTGATEIFLHNGRRMPAINIYRNNRLLVTNCFSKVDHPYPFMLIQSQAESEAILADLLSRNGIVVERGVELVSVSETESRVTVQLKHGSGQSESFVFDYLFAADGAHSSVRKQLGLTFKGDAYAEKWLLYDMELTLRLAQDEAHAFILDQGALFMVRIKSDIWRIIGNVSDLLSYLPAGSEPGKIHWQSDFSISHRITDKFSSGRIFLGGDAAHIHSGLGARGMNLGIEDAFVFAELYANNQLHVYHDKRTQAVRDTVRQIRSLTEMMRGKSIPSKLFRKVAPAVLPAVFPLIEKNIRQFVLGLNHDV